MTIFERIRMIIVDQLGVDEGDVTMESSFRDDLDADSLDLVELIMAMEEVFGGEISDEEAQVITTVGDAVRFLEAHMGYVPDTASEILDRDRAILLEYLSGDKP